MTFAILTMATPEQIAAFRAGGRKAQAKPKKFKRTPQLVEQLIRFALDDSWVELQIPMRVPSPNEMKREWGLQKRKERERETVIRALHTQLRGLDRSRIEHMTLTRISSGKLDKKDNLPFSFKHTCDPACAWIVEGPDCFEADGKLNPRVVDRIGHYDDQLLATGRFEWDYEQTTHETDKRLQGIRIRLQLRSPQGSSPAM